MTKLIASFVFAVLILALAPPALNAGPLCPLLNATKHGTYKVSGTGTAIGVGPVAAVGEVTYDGLGNSVATFTVNINGNVHTFANVTGTYTVKADCTGTHLEAGSHYSFVVSPDGDISSWIETDPGSVFSGTEVRLKPVEDADAQVHSSDKPAPPASRHLVAVQPANFRSRTGLVGERPSVPSKSL